MNVTLCKISLAVALMFAVATGSPTSDELDSKSSSHFKDNLPWIQDFPLPLTTDDNREKLCQYQAFKVYRRVKRQSWLSERATARLHYESAKRSCCLLDFPLVSLHSCIEGHRRDVINTYCSKELQRDLTGTRAHPCCFSLSSQRYLCFERYYNDVINAPITPPVDDSEITLTEMTSANYQEWLLAFLRDRSICDVTAQSHDQPPHSGPVGTISMTAYEPPEYLLESSQRNPDCCRLNKEDRLNCFMTKKSDLHEAYCSENSHFCCDLFGQDMYDCFRMAIISHEENSKDSISDSGSNDVTSDLTTSLTDDDNAKRKIIADDVTGQFDDTLEEYDDVTRANAIELNGVPDSEENMEIEVINDVIAQEDENATEDEKEASNEYDNDVTTTPSDRPTTEMKVDNTATTNPVPGREVNETTIAINASGSFLQSRTTIQRHQLRDREQMIKVNQTVSVEISKRKRKQNVLVKPLNPKSLLRCCKFGAAVGIRERNRENCSVKNLMGLIKRNRNLSSHLSSQRSRRNCLISLRKCCLRETQDH